MSETKLGRPFTPSEIIIEIDVVSKINAINRELKKLQWYTHEKVSSKKFAVNITLCHLEKSAIVEMFKAAGWSDMTITNKTDCVEVRIIR